MENERPIDRMEGNAGRMEVGELVTPSGEPIDAHGRALALREEAMALLRTGAFEASLAAYDRALEYAREAGDDTFIDWMFACRAAAAAECGPADTELVELKKILLRASDSETGFRAAYNGARIYELRRDFKKALFYARIAQKHGEALGDPLLRASAESFLGGMLSIDSHFAEASEAYRRALEISAPPADVSPLWRAFFKDNLGYCLICLDRVGEGLALVHEAFAFIEAEGARAHTVVPLLNLCFGYLKSDRFEEARYFGEEGLLRAPLAGDRSVEKNFLYLLGETCQLSGDLDAARDYFDRLASLYPEFRNLRAYLEVFDFRNVINLKSW